MHGEQANRSHGDIHAGTLVRGTCVRVSSDAARVGMPGLPPSIPTPNGGDGEREPRIELIRSGDVIQAIDIICGCGQHIRLHCHYQDAK
jgi:hypothetical protein